MQNVEKVLHRMMDSVGVKNLSELAHVLGVTSAAITNWKTRGSIPESQIRRVAQIAGDEVDDIATGCATFGRGAAEKELLHIYRRLSKEGKAKLLRRAIDELVLRN